MMLHFCNCLSQAQVNYISKNLYHMYNIHTGAQTLIFFRSADAINSYQNDPLNCNVTAPNFKTLCTGGIFATYPQDFLSLGIGFLDQVLQV